MTNSPATVTPEVGMGCSYGAGSDSYPATIHYVSPSGREVGVSQDEILVGGEWKEGEYEAESYVCLPQPEAPQTIYTLRKNGTWVVKGQPMSAYWCRLYIGRRTYRQDPHF